MKINKMGLLAPMVLLISLPAWAEQVVTTPTDTAKNNSVLLDTITVTGTRTETSIGDSPVSVSVISRQDIEKKGGESAAELLRDVPGVNIDDSIPGTKHVRMRGESSRRITILVDGQAMTDHSDFGAPLMIAPANIERIEIIRGPASVLYGASAIGGVINIITRKGGDKPLQGEVGGSYYSGTDGWQSQGALYGSQGGFDYRLSGTTNRHHDRRVPRDSNSQGADKLKGSAYNNDDVALHLGYTFGAEDNHYLAIKGERHQTAAETWTDPQDLDGVGVNLSPPNAPPFLDIDANLSNINANVPKRDLKKVGLFYEGKDLSALVRKVHVDGYYQTVDRDFENIIKTNGIVDVTPPPPIPIPPYNGSFDLDINATSVDKNTTYGGTAQIDLQFHPDHYTIIGLYYLMDELKTNKETQFKDGVLAPLPPIPVPFPPDNQTSNYHATMQTLSGFLQDQWQFADHWRLTAGARYYYVESKLKSSSNPIPGYADKDTTHNWVSSLGLTYSGIKDMTLRALYSEGFITPTLPQKFSETFAGGEIVYGDPDLKPETSRNFELGARYENNGWLLDASAYYARARNYITFQNCGSGVSCPTPANAPPLQQDIYVNASRAETYGLELIAEYALASLPMTVYTSGSLIRRELDWGDRKTHYSGVPPLSGRVGVRYDWTFDKADLQTDVFTRAASSFKKENQNYKHGDPSERDIERYSGWATLNLGLNARLHSPIEQHLGIHFNNILNKGYQPASSDMPYKSGMPAMGRNVIATYKIKF